MILVTGANGLVGRALVQDLINEGCQVRAHVRRLPSASNSKIEYVSLDFADAGDADYQKLVSGCSAVVHAAGLVHKPNAAVKMFEDLNVAPTRGLAEAAKNSGVASFVFLSTSAVYGSAFEDVSEDSPVNPDTAYASSKLKCEDLLAEIEPAANVVCLRPSLVFGEGDRGNMLSLIRQIRKGMYVGIKDNRARKSVIYADDLALAIRLCLGGTLTGHHVFNVTNPKSIGVNELDSAIAGCLGRPEPLRLPLPLLQGLAVISNGILFGRSPLTTDRLNKLTATTTLCTDKLVDKIRFRPRWEVQKALTAEIAWARSEGIC